MLGEVFRATAQGDDVMPLKSAKPCYRVVVLNDRYVVTAFPVVNRMSIPGETISIPKGDPAEFIVMLDGLIDRTRARLNSQRK